MTWERNKREDIEHSKKRKTCCKEGRMHSEGGKAMKREVKVEGTNKKAITSYPLFICEIKDKPLLYFQAWKQSHTLLQLSRNLYYVLENSLSRWGMFSGLGIDSWLWLFWGVHVLGGRTQKWKTLLVWMWASNTYCRCLKLINNMLRKTNAWGMFTVLSCMHTWTYRLTFRRQALVTTCLGSTTSTRGSLMATLRMQLMSNPYTFSHPVNTHRHKHLGHSKPCKCTHTHFLSFYSFFCEALLSLFLQH